MIDQEHAQYKSILNKGKATLLVDKGKATLPVRASEGSDEATGSAESATGSAESAPKRQKTGDVQTINDAVYQYWQSMPPNEVNDLQRVAMILSSSPCGQGAAERMNKSSKQVAGASAKVIIDSLPRV